MILHANQPRAQQYSQLSAQLAQRDNTQSVVISFADGATATLSMVGGAGKPSRLLHLVGTYSEIQGVLEDSRFVIRHIEPQPSK